jgi:hypothetical protein
MNKLATSPPPKASGAVKTILSAWIVAGAFDLLTAILVYSVIMQRTTDLKILQGIGRSAVGRWVADNNLALAGIGVHFFIALCFTLLYFFLYPRLPFLRRSPIISGLLYGLFAWCVMNLAMLPLFQVAKFPSRWDSMVRGAVILMFCIGMPISIIISSYYVGRNRLLN